MKTIVLLLVLLLVGIPVVYGHDEVGGGESSYAIEKIVYDTAGGGVEYFGFALPGTATSAATWKMFRITTVSSDFTLEWADGDQEYDNEWDERAGTVAYE